jgi:hypothetical protein
MNNPAGAGLLMTGLSDSYINGNLPELTLPIDSSRITFKGFGSNK